MPSTNTQTATETVISDDYARDLVMRLYGDRLAITVDEVTQILPVSDKHIHSLIKQERFPSLTLGRRVLVPVGGLIEWMQYGGPWRTEDERLRGMLHRVENRPVPVGASSATWRTD